MFTTLKQGRVVGATIDIYYINDLVMKKQLLASVFSVTLFVAPFMVSAQTTELTEALKRMDAIIAEMNALRSEFSKLASQVGVSTPAPAVQGTVSGGVLGDDLAYGSTNDDIARIQRLLATDPTIYEYGVDSGFFGPKTQEAIRRFQSRFGLDTVGVIGPSTRALFETFFAAYPDENYPDGVLAKPAPTPVAPVVSTPVTTPTVASAVTASTNKLKSISVDEDDDEYIVRSYLSSGTRNRDLILYPDDFDELVEMIADELSVTESEVRSHLDEDEFEEEEEDDEYSESAAEDAIDEADEAIDELRDDIRVADDDGDDIEEADRYYDKARSEYRKARDNFDEEDFENAVKDAEDAVEAVEKAYDALDEDASGDDDVEEIAVRVYEDEASVKVEYEDGDDERFDISSTDEDEIIEEIADELDMDEDDVEDLTEFLYQ